MSINQVSNVLCEILVSVNDDRTVTLKINPNERTVKDFNSNQQPNSVTLMPNSAKTEFMAQKELFDNYRSAKFRDSIKTHFVNEPMY